MKIAPVIGYYYPDRWQVFAMFFLLVSSPLSSNLLTTVLLRFSVSRHLIWIQCGPHNGIL